MPGLPAAPHGAVAALSRPSTGGARWPSHARGLRGPDRGLSFTQNRRSVMTTARTRFLAVATAVLLILALAAPASAGSLGKVSWTPTSVNFGKVQVGDTGENTVWV